MIKLVLRGRSFLAICPFLISCVSEQVKPDVCESASLEISIVENIDSSCGENDGSFSVLAIGGEAPYTYESTLGTNTTGSFTEASAGVYGVEVTDSNGCFSTTEVTIQNANGVSIDEINVLEAGCGTNQGQIDVAVSGGTQPYLISLNDVIQDDGSFTDLETGSYTLKVEDSEGCEITQAVTVNSGISYQNAIQVIIETNCAISGCHNGSVSPDLRTFESIQSSAGRIKARTQNRSMPRGRTLTQTEIDLIACWVDDGALNN